MGMKKLLKSKTEAAPEPEDDKIDDTEAEAEAEAVQEEIHEVAVARETGIASPVASAGIGALIKAVESEESGGGGLTFPCVKVLSGATVNAAFDAPDFNPAEVKDDLPVGRKPFPAVLLTYRLRITSWPSGYDETATEKVKPAWSGVVGSADGATIAKTLAACKVYQYTKRDDKAKFDFDTSEVGHLRPTLDFLVWVEGIGLVEIRNPEGYTPTINASKNLAGLCDPKSGSLDPQPVECIPNTYAPEGKRTWKTQAVNFKPMLSKTGADLWDAYQSWLKGALEDPETESKFAEWASGTITETQVGLLEKAAML